MTKRGRIAACGLAAATLLAAAAVRWRPGIQGAVRWDDGTPAAGVLLTMTPENRALSHTVVSGADGRFQMPSMPDGAYELVTHGAGIAADTTRIDLQGGAVSRLIELSVGRRVAGFEDLPGSALLGALPEGPEKRRFILDCTGCHLLDARVARPAGEARSASSWEEATARMLGLAGPASGFPVIGAGREPGPTAVWLASHLDAARPPSSRAFSADPATTGATITEYPIPVPADLPHDVAVTGEGKIAITGMFTHRMYLLDPETGGMETVAIPVQNANPRAVEIDARGTWWVLLGNPMTIARYEPALRDWKTFPVGVYPHSIALGRDGRVWYNGHFTRNPEVLGVVDPTTGTVTRFEVPAHPLANVGAGPIPYELRAGPDGKLWGSELLGNRVFSYDPATGRFAMFDMPSAHSGPRRLDIGADGTVWIPLYGAGRLARLDPRTGGVVEIDLPLPDAAPYVVRVDPRNDRVWIGTGAADAILAYDPGSRRFTTYRLPTRGAMIRHIAIDSRNGDVWAAYGASPGVPSKVARIRASQLGTAKG